VPTLYHDIVHHPAFAKSDVSSVASWIRGSADDRCLLAKLTEAFKPDFVRQPYGRLKSTPYRQPERGQEAWIRGPGGHNQ